MATKKTTGTIESAASAKKVKNTGVVTPARKSAPAKKVALAKTATPVKKVAPAKKSAPDKKATPAKTATPVKKVAPAKKPIPAKKTAPAKAATPVKKVAPAKKPTPAKKAAPVKASTPVKKVTPAKKPTPAKKAAPVKTATSAKGAAPAKKSAPVKKVVSAKKSTPAKKATPAKAATPVTEVTPEPEKTDKEAASRGKTGASSKAATPKNKKTNTAKDVEPGKPSLQAHATEKVKMVALPTKGTSVASKPSDRSTRPAGGEAERRRKIKATLALLRSEPDWNDFLLEQERVLRQMREELLPSMNSVTRENLRSGESNVSSSSGQHIGDAGSEAEQRDITILRLDKDRELLFEIDAALDRIRKGTYGICEISHEPIPRKRLQARPFCRLTVRCQEEYEKKYGVFSASRYRDTRDVGFSGLQK